MVWAVVEARAMTNSRGNIFPKSINTPNELGEETFLKQKEGER